jgi:hypothetical protein
MIATISADIVRSTSLRTRDLIQLRKRLLRLFGELERDIPGFWARIIKGDGIECFIPDHRYVLRIAVLLKLFVKMQADKCECSAMLQRHGIRFSIGIGEINYVNKKEDIIDGPAIYISGRNLDDIGRRHDTFSLVEVDGAPQYINCMLDSYVAMISNLIDSYSAKQAEVVYFKILGLKEREISKRLKIFQSSVNTRSTNAQWGLLNTAIKDFENVDFEKICG